MAWTRRGLLSSVAGFFVPDELIARLGIGGDWAILGISSWYSEPAELAELVGDWKDHSWRRVIWRFEAVEGQPGHVLATHYPAAPEPKSFRGKLIRGKNGDRFLDLTPASEPTGTPEQPTVHQFYKLTLIHVDAVSVGTPRRIRREFDYHPSKPSFRLHMHRPEVPYLRDLEDTLKVLDANINSYRYDRGAPTFLTTQEGVAAFLEKYGDESKLWEKKEDANMIVRRRFEAN